jgi:cell division protein FtsZ
VLRQGVQGISDIITKTGLKNTDFADVESIMKGQGYALMGIGYGIGENRAKEAALGAIDNPLLEDTSIDGATQILVNITGESDDSLFVTEFDEVLNVIRAKADPDVNLIHGVRFDPEVGEGLRVTVIATGFQSGSVKAAGASSAAESQLRGAGEFIDFETFADMKGGPGRPGCLGRRGYHEDLDIPTAIRNHNYEESEEALKVLRENETRNFSEKRAADGRDA